MLGKVIRLMLCLVALWGPVSTGAGDLFPADEPDCPMVQAAATCCCSGGQTQACPCSVQNAPQAQAQDWLPAPSGPTQPMQICSGDSSPALQSILDQDAPGHAPGPWHPPRPIYLRLSTLLI